MKTLAFSLLLSSLGAAFAMDRVAAQTVPATGAQLVTLGTAGGPLPRANRAQSSNLLVVNGALYLIDAGGSVTSRIVQSGHDFRKVGKIFGNEVEKRQGCGPPPAGSLTSAIGATGKHMRSAGRPARSRGCKSLAMKE